MLLGSHGHARATNQSRSRLYNHGRSKAAENLCRPAGAPIRHDPRAMGCACPARPLGRPQAVGTRRTARSAADLAHPPARPPGREQADRAPRRSERSARQPVIPDAGRAAVARTAQRARHRHDVDGARRARCQDDRAHAARSWAGQGELAHRHHSQYGATRSRRRGLSIMSEKPLKIVPAPEAKTAPVADAPSSKKSRRFARLGRKQLRMILLVVLPAIALLAGIGFYLSGGRYISTDNAYVGAQKVLITPDISDKIIHVAVHEGQHVNPGDELFTLDPVPYRLALDTAQAKLAAARSDYDKLKTNLASLSTMSDLSKKNVDLKQRDVDRKTKLVSTQAGSQTDLDTAIGALVTAQLISQFTVQQRDTTLNQL